MCTLSRLHVIFCFTVRTDTARSIPSFILYLLFLASPRLVSRRSPGLVYVSFHVLIKSKRGIRWRGSGTKERLEGGRGDDSSFSFDRLENYPPFMAAVSRSDDFSKFRCRKRLIPRTVLIELKNSFQPVIVRHSFRRVVAAFIVPCFVAVMMARRMYFHAYKMLVLFVKWIV